MTGKYLIKLKISYKKRNSHTWTRMKYQNIISKQKNNSYNLFMTINKMLSKHPDKKISNKKISLLGIKEKNLTLLRILKKHLPSHKIESLSIKFIVKLQKNIMISILGLAQSLNLKSPVVSKRISALWFFQLHPKADLFSRLT